VTDSGSSRPMPLSPAAYPGETELSVATVTWGPGIPDESSLRLLSNPSGKRVLQLGVGCGHNAVSLALAGAKVIAVDPDIAAIEKARSFADTHEVKVELHHGDPAEIPFIRADQIDNAFSVFTLHRVDDLDRVLRQVNRVLRTGGSFTCSLPHPAWAMVDHNGFGPSRIQRAYGDGGEHEIDGITMTTRSIANIISAFGRANFRIDALLEPYARADTAGAFWSETLNIVPAALIVRGRKDGV